jgi:hypothetical protein
MRAWWQGTRLVAERGLVENLRSRSFKVVTALLLLISIGLFAARGETGAVPRVT